MKICIIYHSETGTTWHVAQHLASACTDARLIEVFDRADYVPLTRFMSRAKKRGVKRQHPSNRHRSMSRGTTSL